MDGYLSFIHFAPGFFGTCITRERTSDCFDKMVMNRLADSALVSPLEQAELNNVRTRRMFAAHKKTRKKAVKSQPAGVNSLNGSATTSANVAVQKPAGPMGTLSTPNVLTVKRKKSPTAASTKADKDSFPSNQVSATTASPPKDDAGGVNVLQVRKKRKIAPTVVPPPPTVAIGTATSPATNSESANGGSEPSREAPNTNQRQQDEDEELGTYDNPVEL